MTEKLAPVRAPREDGTAAGRRPPGSWPPQAAGLRHDLSFGGIAGVALGVEPVSAPRNERQSGCAAGMRIGRRIQRRLPTDRRLQALAAEAQRCSNRAGSSLWTQRHSCRGSGTTSRKRVSSRRRREAATLRRRRRLIGGSRRHRPWGPMPPMWHRAACIRVLCRPHTVRSAQASGQSGEAQCRQTPLQRHTVVVAAAPFCGRSPARSVGDQVTSFEESNTWCHRVPKRIPISLQNC